MSEETTSAESNASSQTIKGILFRSLGQLGVGAVLAVLLMLYYGSETKRWDEQRIEDNKRWDERTKADESRWEQLFKQYRDGTSEATKAIEACCYDRLKRLDEIESSLRRRANQ